MAWIGKWIFAVGVIHTLFGIAFMKTTLAVLWSERLFNTVNGQPDREATFWFLYTGFLLLIVGALVNQVEKHGLTVSSFVNWALVVLTIIGVVVMPISGIWLLLPPVAGLLIRKKKTKCSGET
ncbi:MAG: hypothetical protein JSW07_06810 [bacterium]|nr:MAG: hypothetical protein JSW07_06810 [bacterium]